MPSVLNQVLYPLFEVVCLDLVVFITYYAVEKYFLHEEIAKLYEHNPNYKYIFYLSLAFGLWGIIDSLFGVIKYFQASSEAEQLRRKVEELEREL